MKDKALIIATILSETDTEDGMTSSKYQHDLMSLEKLPYKRTEATSTVVETFTKADLDAAFLAGRESMREEAATVVKPYHEPVCHLSECTACRTASYYVTAIKEIPL